MRELSSSLTILIESLCKHDGLTPPQRFYITFVESTVTFFIDYAFLQKQDVGFC